MHIKNPEDVRSFEALHSYEKSRGISKWNQTRMVIQSGLWSKSLNVRCLTFFEKMLATFQFGDASKQNITNVRFSSKDVSQTISDIFNKSTSSTSNAPAERLNNILMTAVSANNLTTVKKLIEDGADVNFRNSLGDTPLLMAAHNENVGLMRILIDAGADVNVQDTNGATPLILAAQIGDVKILNTLIQKGADVNARSSSTSFIYNTALIAATAANNTAAAKALINAGAMVEVKSSEELTPIMNAALHGNVELIELLVDAGANINAEDELGTTPVMFALMSGKTNAFETCIKHGGDVSHKNKEGMTSLMWAAQSENLSILHIILRVPDCKVNEQNSFGHTAIALATSPKIIRALHDVGADVNIRDNEGRTALNQNIRRIATRLENLNELFERVKALINAGATVNRNDDIILAVESLKFSILKTDPAMLKIFRVLIDAGVDVNSRNAENKSVLDIARESNIQPICDLLIAAGAR